MTVWVLIYAWMGLTAANQNGMDGRIEGYEMQQPHAKVFLTEAGCAVARERYAAKIHIDRAAILTCVEAPVLQVKP